jgi:hypothetical protein
LLSSRDGSDLEQKMSRKSAIESSQTAAGRIIHETGVKRAFKTGNVMVKNLSD